MSSNLDRHTVTAVLVAHDGAQWLPETLKALLSQSQPVHRLIAVDTESRDSGPAVLAEIVGDGNLLRLPRTTGFGDAVAEALRHPAASAAVPAPPASATSSAGSSGGYPSSGDRVEWVWLVHDDSVPTTHTLRVLLSAAEANPTAAVIGPKLRDWYDRRVLTEVGVTMDGAGRRDTGLDRREFDQGQHDGLREVFAVSTAGMLVRRDVWDQLGGLDPELGMFRDDIDFGWRACAAGHRVVMVTDAVMYHAEASVRGRRTGMAEGEHGYRPRRVDRRNAMYVLLSHLPMPALLTTFLRLTVGSLLRTLAFLLAKRSQHAADELAALRAVLGSPVRLWRARRLRAPGRKRGYAAFRRFQHSRQTARRITDLAGVFLPERRDPFADDGYGETDPADASPNERGMLRRLLSRPGVLLLLALTAVAAVAERSVLTAGSGLGGGALVPAWGGASDLWADYLTGWHQVGLGSDVGSPLYIGVLALLSTLLLGKPWLAVGVLVLGAVPLAGISAYLATRRLLPSAAVRAWLGASYALLPVATGAVAGGRLGTLVALILLPAIALSVSTMLMGPPAAARRSAWAAGLLLAVAMSFVPLIWLLSLVAGALVWLAFGERVRGLGTGMTIALALPALLQLPTTLWLLLHPTGFLLEAGLNRPGMTAADLPADRLLTLNPGGPGTPDLWVTAGLLLVGFAALAVRRRRFMVLAGWMLALYGILAAILAGTIAVPQGGGTAPAWPGMALAVAAIGVLLAAAGGAQWGADAFARGGAVRRAVVVLLALVAVATPLMAAGSWIVAGVKGPLTTIGSDIVPPFITSSARDKFQPRTLVLRRESDGRLTYTVLRGRAPRIGEVETPVDPAARTRLDAQVAALGSGRAGDEGSALARFGIQYVLAPGPPGALAANLDGLPDLSRLSRTQDYSTWRVTKPAGRLLLIEGGTVRQLPVGPVEGRVSIPPGTGTRLLLLTEPADGGWLATLDGADVPSRTVDGWAQGYDIPAAGGTFVLTRGMWLRHIWLVLQGLALITAAALALPGGEGTDEPWSWRRGRGQAGPPGRKGGLLGRLRGRGAAPDGEDPPGTDGLDGGDGTERVERADEGAGAGTAGIGTAGIGTAGVGTVGAGAAFAEPAGIAGSDPGAVLGLGGSPREPGARRRDFADPLRFAGEYDDAVMPDGRPGGIEPRVADPDLDPDADTGIGSAFRFGAFDAALEPERPDAGGEPPDRGGAAGAATPPRDVADDPFDFGTASDPLDTGTGSRPGRTRNPYPDTGAGAGSTTGTGLGTGLSTGIGTGAGVGSDYTADSGLGGAPFDPAGDEGGVTGFDPDPGAGEAPGPESGPEFGSEFGPAGEAVGPDTDVPADYFADYAAPTSGFGVDPGFDFGKGLDSGKSLDADSGFDADRDTGYLADPGHPLETGYQSDTGYQDDTGYQSDTGYQDDTGYPKETGYPGDPGSPAGASYLGDTSYPGDPGHPGDPAYPGDSSYLGDSAPAGGTSYAAESPYAPPAPGYPYDSGYPADPGAGGSAARGSTAGDPAPSPEPVLPPEPGSASGVPAPPDADPAAVPPKPTPGRSGRTRGRRRKPSRFDSLLRRKRATPAGSDPAPAPTPTNERGTPGQAGRPEDPAEPPAGIPPAGTGRTSGIPEFPEPGSSERGDDWYTPTRGQQ